MDTESIVERIFNAVTSYQEKSTRDVLAKVDQRLRELPKPVDGKPGVDGVDGKPGRDGIDGNSVTVDDVLPAIKNVLLPLLNEEAAAISVVHVSELSKALIDQFRNASDGAA